MISLKYMMLLAVCCIVIPIHGQKESPKSDNQQKPTEAINKPAPSPIQQGASQTKGDGANNQTNCYLYRLLSPEIIPQVGLVFVGVVGIIVAICTLRDIKKQTVNTQETAKAALLNAQAVINAERAWIEVAIQEHPRKDGRFIFKAINRGRTPAEIVSVDAGKLFVRSEPWNFPTEPDYSCHVNRPPPLQVPGVWFDIWTFNPTAIIDAAKKKEILSIPKEFLCFYGRITYWDMVSARDENSIPHETRWCYAFTFFDDGVLRDVPFIETGPTKYRGYAQNES